METIKIVGEWNANLAKPYEKSYKKQFNVIFNSYFYKKYDEFDGEKLI